MISLFTYWNQIFKNFLPFSSSLSGIINTSTYILDNQLYCKTHTNHESVTHVFCHTNISANSFPKYPHYSLNNQKKKKKLNNMKLLLKPVA